jgi:hypothetical protein
MVELGTRCTTERVQVGNSPPTAARAVFLPDSFARDGKATEGRPGSEPDSGNPTVRDRRGPAETWTMGELGTHLAYRKSECWKLSA